MTCAGLMALIWAACAHCGCSPHCCLCDPALRSSSCSWWRSAAASLEVTLNSKVGAFGPVLCRARAARDEQRWRRAVETRCAALRSLPLAAEHVKVASMSGVDTAELSACERPARSELAKLRLHTLHMTQSCSKQLFEHRNAPRRGHGR